MQRTLTPMEERMQRDAAASRALDKQNQRERDQRNAQRNKIEFAAEGVLESLGVAGLSKLGDHKEFGAVVSGFNEAAKCARMHVTGIGSVLESKMLTDGQRIVAAADKGKAGEAATVALLEREDERLAALVQDVERRMAAARTPPPAIAAQVAEARAVLRAMPADERAKLVREAKGEDAALLTYAIGGVPAFMSGADFGLHRHAVNTIYGLRDPALLYLVDEVPKAQAVVRNAIDAVPGLFASVVDYEAANALRGA